MKQIDRDTHKVKSKNRYKTKTDKTQIVIGCSLRKSNYHINRMKHKEYGNSKRWNTYTISRSGKIYEHYDPQFYSDFLGMKDVDKKSISIVLENMGGLVKTPQGEFINWLNEKCLPEFVVEKRFMAQYYWEAITKEQYDSLHFLCGKLCDDFGIKKKIMEFHHPHKDVERFNRKIII